MNLLAAKLYDPTTAVSKATTAALAMTAIDTTNLRLPITVPAHGMVRFRLAAVLHGATTFPSILLGVMNGSTVLGRVAPIQSLGNTAVATALVNVEADFVVTGLTPGAMNVDAAYGVETLVASTGLKYGGPNNTTANDAFGAFVFEAWDPQAQTANSTLAVDANGRVDVSKIGGTTQTARDIGASVLLSNGTGTGQISLSAGTVTTGALSANTITAASIAAAALNGKGDWNIGKTGYSLTQAFPANFASMSITAGGLLDITQTGADKVWGTATRRLTDGTNIVLAKGTGVTGFNDLDAAGVRGAVGLASNNLDTQLAAVFKTASYTAPDNAGIATINAALPVLDTHVLSRAAPGDAMALTAAAVDSVLDETVEGVTTFRQMLRLFGAVLLGKATGLDTGFPTYRDIGDSKNRVAATTDASGNRSVVTLDPS